MNQRNVSTDPYPRAAPISKGLKGQTNGTSTSEVLVAVARDTLDVATELVRDGVALARLEVQRTIRDAAPRLVWGAMSIVCAATASVCAVIAGMMGLEAIVPSVAWRLLILAGALFLVAFVGLNRAKRPEPHTRRRMRRDKPVTEGTSRGTWSTHQSDRVPNSILPPPNA